MRRIASNRRKTAEINPQERPTKSPPIATDASLHGPHFEPTCPHFQVTGAGNTAQIQNGHIAGEAKKIDKGKEIGPLQPMGPEEKAKREAARLRAAAKAKELTETIETVMRSFDDDEVFGTACDQYQAIAQEFAAVIVAERIRRYCQSLGMNDASRAADLEQLDLLEKKLEVADNVRTWLARSNLGFRHKNEYRQLFAERSGRSDAPGGRFVLKRYGNSISNTSADGRITNWADVVDVIAEPTLADVLPFFRR